MKHIYFKVLQHIGSLALLLVCLAICYFTLDIPLFFHSQSLREDYYIPLRILSIITSPGTQLALWSILFVWFLGIKKNKNLSVEIYPIIASMITSNTLIRFIKIFIGRSRPDMLLYEGVYQLKLLSFERFYTSFPSGHASTFASIFGLFAAKYPKHGLFWISAALGLSLCRVFIGAHFLSDVLFGNYLGFVFTWFFYFNQLDKEPVYLIYAEESFKWNSITTWKALFKKDGQLEQ